MKELNEFLVGLKDMALLYKSAMKDGKIDMNDLPLLAQVLAKQQELVDAFSGLSAVQDEIKGASLDQVTETIGILLAAVKDVKAA
jgi:hypothetical protein